MQIERKTKILSSRQTLTAARTMRDSLLNSQTRGTPLRLWPVVIPAPADGYYFVVEAGFASGNGFDVVA